MIRRKGSTRKMGLIELKAFFFTATGVPRPEVRLVQVGNERDVCRLFDEDTVDTKIRYISRSSDWKSNPVLNLLKLGRKDRVEEGV